jgi:hypothetical protein
MTLFNNICRQPDNAIEKHLQWDNYSISQQTAEVGSSILRKSYSNMNFLISMSYWHVL